jgi:hypothetical protein
VYSKTVNSSNGSIQTYFGTTTTWPAHIEQKQHGRWAAVTSKVGPNGVYVASGYDS